MDPTAIISSTIGAAAQIGGMALQQKYNRELADYQNQLQLEQWNRENEYNKPINQMARLKEAGLNPNLVYGSGATSLSAHSPNLTAGQPADVQGTFSRVGDIFSNYLSFKMQRNAERKSEADADKAEYEALLTRMDAMKEANQYYFDYQRSDDDINEQESDNVVPVVGWSFGRNKILNTDVNVKSLKSRVAKYTDPSLGWLTQNEKYNLTTQQTAEVTEKVGLIREQIAYWTNKARYAKTEADLIEAYGEIDKWVSYAESGLDFLVNTPIKALKAFGGRRLPKK